MMARAATESRWLLLATLMLLAISSSSALSLDTAHHNSSEADRQALLCLRSHLIDPSGALDSWTNESFSICDWRGVLCSIQHPARVVALDLASLNISGSIPPCIGKLSLVSAIDMTSNQIRGQIPPEIGNLTQLRYLNLSSNSLTGHIPGTISYCSHLLVIRIMNNYIEGEIPSSIAKLQFLQEITLSNNNLTGTIPSGIGFLPNLQYLFLPDNNLVGNIPKSLGLNSLLYMVVLRRNSLTGGIPDSLANCSSLYHLDLSKNKLSGNIPSSLFDASSLIELDLSYNNFSGSIPSSSSVPAQLEHIRFTGNNLTGNIPATLGNFSSLSILLLGMNNLQGSIPESITGISNLHVLDLAYNNLSGTVPQRLYTIMNLTYLSLGVNEFIGNIPSNIGYTLPNIQILNMEGNHFDGILPVSLVNATNLQAIRLRDNTLTGKIPAFWSLSNLLELDLGANQFEVVDWNGLTTITSNSQLEKVYFDHNNIGGMLPDSIGLLPRSLKEFYLTENNFTGTIPSQIGNLTNLEVLQLGGNIFFGGIPSTLGNLTNLFALSLARNRLSGEIPEIIGDATQLSELYLQENNFGGTIPPSLARCTKLVMMNLSYNMIEGSIPAELFTIHSLSKGLDLSYNKLTGPISSNIGGLINLGSLKISNNRLSGEIPSTLGGCLLLESICLQENLLSGSIPTSFTNLRGIIEMDLSQNNLSGDIPSFLASFSSLNYLNLSFNNLEGVVPTGGAFSNSSKVFIQGNKMLCSKYPMLDLPVCKQAQSKKLKTSSIILIAVGLTSGVILFMTCGAVFIFRKRRQSKKVNEQSCNELKRFSYSDLAGATNEFSPANLVGSGRFGTVYRGTFKSKADPVAIKVFRLEQIGAHKTFVAECEVLKNTRHRNLIRVISLCSSYDLMGNEFKALILEYMGNGNLESRIHSKVANDKIKKPLNLGSRVLIALDIAAAVDYLHNWCTPPLVHCDLKPSNVLLDDEMVAHVSDFGLAKFLYDNSAAKLHSSTNIFGPRGSIGYIAPEYGMGYAVSTAGDIYSYGVILLEMLTGNHPTDDMFQNGMTLHKLVESALSQDISEVLDSSLLPYYNVKEANPDSASDDQAMPRIQSCIKQLAKLGLRCSVDSPKDRPAIEDVYSEIITIREAFSACSADENYEDLNF